VSVPDARISRAIDVTRRQVTQLSRLVDDLLDVSRVTQGRIELQRRAVEVSHIVTLAVETVQSLMSEKRQRLSVVNSANFGMWVDADPARLTQCVVNVLTNAAKYTDPGGEICLSTHAGGDSVTIEVSDTGVGIAPELLPQVFDLFVQGERALDRSQGGLGVGLAVTKRLLEMHQGTISARSPGLGGGSTFAIRLPLNKRPPTSEAGPDAPEAAAVRVLIVDDNQDSADSLAALLRLEAHEAQAVYSARQALVQAALFKPDIVLLDIGLPEMNGYELAQQLRQRPELRGTRLVALTGYGQREDRRRAQAAGFDAYLIKPVSLTRLADTLAGFAGKPRR
jgi:CheY-like chemotaxis protein